MILIQTNPYKSIIVLNEEEKPITLSEGDNIQFDLEGTGEAKVGHITKFSGKNEKLKIQIIPKDQTYEEIWPVVFMNEGSLKLVEDE
jgi:hypothetical protein